MSKHFRLSYALIGMLILVPCFVSAQETKNPNSQGLDKKLVEEKITNKEAQQEQENSKVQDEQKKPAVANNEANKKETNDKKDEKKDKKDDKKDKPTKGSLTYDAGTSHYRFWTKLRAPEFLYGKNLRLLNNDNPTDRIIYFRHTLDFNLEYRYAFEDRDYTSVFVKATIRNKGIWGDPESIAFTTISTLKETDAVFGAHRHAIPRHILWVRELWMMLSLTDFLCLPFCNNHTLTFGSFPFEVGRGIALGASYAVDASDLGFVPENAVDQYAFGGKLSGDLIKDVLTYDLYGGLLENKADTFENTNLKILGQEFGHRNDQARGFGIINYVVAGRLRWMPKLDPWAKARIEPYILYNHNPEQRIEFIADATSDLGTAGVAGEFEVGNFDFGFDTAFNFGHQSVKGWDRNFLERQNKNGTVIVINTRVRQAPPGEVPNAAKSPQALKVSENQAIIDTSDRAASENGKVIGTNKLGTLINDTHRFTNPYKNEYKGFMFVFDMSYYIYRPDLKVSGGFGYASGDADPNRDAQFVGDSEVDGEYEGFISLQETYSGTRIKSAFLLSGAARIPRPLDFPNPEVFDPFVVSTSRFTNIAYLCAGATWQPCYSCRKWTINPNIFAYWQDYVPHFFNAIKEKNSIGLARPYLGTEVNLFVDSQLLEDLRFFLVTAVFFPGALFRDITGRPLTKAQQAFLDNLDTTGIVNDRVPFVGHDISVYFNTGLEYKF